MENSTIYAFGSQETIDSVLETVDIVSRELTKGRRQGPILAPRNPQAGNVLVRVDSLFSSEPLVYRGTFLDRNGAAQSWSDAGPCLISDINNKHLEVKKRYFGYVDTFDYTNKLPRAIVDDGIVLEISGTSGSGGGGNAGLRTIVGYSVYDVVCVGGIQKVYNMPTYQYPNMMISYGTPVFSHTAGCCECGSGSGTTPVYPPLPPAPPPVSPPTTCCPDTALPGRIYATFTGDLSCLGVIALDWQGGWYQCIPGLGWTLYDDGPPFGTSENYITRPELWDSSVYIKGLYLEIDCNNDTGTWKWNVGMSIFQQDIARTLGQRNLKIGRFRAGGHYETVLDPALLVSLDGLNCDPFYGESDITSMNFYSTSGDVSSFTGICRSQGPFTFSIVFSATRPIS